MDGSLPPPPAATGRIGPNAVTRIAEALREARGEDAVTALFRDCGLLHHLRTPPETMVPESDVTVLHAGLRARLGLAEAAAVSEEAGRRTAAYLLAHRIPRPVQVLLRLLPPRPAARVLLGAIGRHSWTFSGSGRFRAEAGNPSTVAIEGCPLCRGAATRGAAVSGAGGPLCGYYAATLETLFRALVARGARATETQCEALGDPACVFTLRW
jgi:divinyl protochlorophyllide a 8-vinyl-reductase